MKELSPEARAILEAGRYGDDPTPEDRARLRATIMRATAMGAAVGVALTAGNAAGGALTAVKGAMVIKLLTVAAVVGAASTTAVIAMRGQHVTHEAARDSTAKADTIALEAATLAGEEPPPTDMLSDALAAPPTTHAATPPLPATRAAPRPRPNSADTLEAETNDLREAQEALRDHDAARALQLLDAQIARYGRGALEHERAAARIIALCDLRRTSEAKKALARFRQAYPRSPLLPRVQAACAVPNE